MPSRRERKKERTRKALLDAAMALFAEKGVYGTRVEDITDRADIGKGAFYNYFPSKHALIAELVARGVQAFEEGYLSQMNGETDLGARIGELAQLQSRFLEEHPQYSLIFHQARGLLLARETRADELRDVFAGFLRLLADAMHPGERAADDEPEHDLVDLAAAVAGAVAGYRSYRIAAALGPRRTTAADLLGLGVPELLARLREEEHG